MRCRTRSMFAPGRATRARSGLGLAEMLIALSIASCLLIATGVALDASIRAYQVNQQQAVLLQSSRLAMNRVLSTVRRCKLHAPEDAAQRANFATGLTVTGSGVAMFDEDDVPNVYRYDAATKTVQFVKGGTAYPLIHGVEEFQVTLEPMRSSEAVRTGGGWDLLKRATILITVRTTSETGGVGEGTGRVTMTLSGSVMPRRNTF